FEKRSFDSWLPRILVSSSLTILTTCWEGESAVRTSSPIAFCLTFSMSCLTTRKLTSASSSATRISRSAASMFSALSLPSPRRFLKMRCNLSDKLSNMNYRGALTLSNALLYMPRNAAKSRRPRRSCLRFGCDSQAPGRHLSRAVHSKLVENPGSGSQVCRFSLRQPRDVKENIAATVVRTNKPKALGFEVGHDGAALLASLLAGLSFRSCFRRCGSAGFIAYALLD